MTKVCQISPFPLITIIFPDPPPFILRMLLQTSHSWSKAVCIFWHLCLNKVWQKVLKQPFQKYSTAWRAALKAIQRIRCVEGRYIGTDLKNIYLFICLFQFCYTPSCQPHPIVLIEEVFHSFPVIFSDIHLAVLFMRICLQEPRLDSRRRNADAVPLNS